MKKAKRFIILSGPSCVGKGPLQKVVNKLYKGLIEPKPVLCTSRSPRQGEQHGKDFYFLPEEFIRSLAKSSDFAVSPVRTDWQAIHLPQVEFLLHKNDLVFAEVYYTFGPVLLECVADKPFSSIRIFLTPVSLNTPRQQIITIVRNKLDRRGTDSEDKKKDRSESAPDEIEQAHSYTHRLVNPAGEDDVDEWKCFGTRDNKPGVGEVDSISDLGPNARWLAETFVEIVNGNLPPGDYQREDGQRGRDVPIDLPSGAKRRPTRPR